MSCDSLIQPKRVKTLVRDSGSRAEIYQRVIYSIVDHVTSHVRNM